MSQGPTLTGPCLYTQACLIVWSQEVKTPQATTQCPICVAHTPVVLPFVFILISLLVSGILSVSSLEL